MEILPVTGLFLREAAFLMAPKMLLYLNANICQRRALRALASASMKAGGASRLELARNDSRPGSDTHSAGPVAELQTQ